MEGTNQALYRSLERQVVDALDEPGTTPHAVAAYLAGNEEAVRSLQVQLMLSSVMMLKRDVRLRIFADALQERSARREVRTIPSPDEDRSVTAGPLRSRARVTGDAWASAQRDLDALHAPDRSRSGAGAREGRSEETPEPRIPHVSKAS